MTIRFCRASHLVVCASSALALALTGCPGDSTPPPGTDSGPLGTDAGPGVDAPSLFDGGPAVDAGPSDVDARPADTDAGSSDVDAGPADAGPAASDAGPATTDGGPGGVDAGPASTDGGPGASDGGPIAGGCMPTCGLTDYCDLCASAPVCRVRPANDGRICIDIYDPVCGCDGMTYSNSCQLAAAGIGLFQTGECASVPPPPTGECVTDRDCARREYCATCRGIGGPIMVCLPDGAVC